MQAPAGTVRDHCDLIVSNILRISLDAKPQVKAELYSLAKKLMLRCGPEKIWQAFLLFQFPSFMFFDQSDYLDYFTISL